MKYQGKKIIINSLSRGIPVENRKPEFPDLVQTYSRQETSHTRPIFRKTALSGVVVFSGE